MLSINIYDKNGIKYEEWKFSILPPSNDDKKFGKEMKNGSSL